MRESDYEIVKPNKDKSIKYSLAYFNLCSEVADVKIMLGQIELMLSKDAIDISENRKLQRLNERLLKIKP